ncbi:MAG: MFS transporter [Chthoniobacterales bacterium]
MSQHIVAEKDKVPVFQKIMYGAGSGSFQMANDGVKGLAYSIYNITLGLPPSWVGMVLMLSRLFDAFTDPLMGKISDDTRTRWGRRRPYIFVGSFLTAFAFVLIWFVPANWSHTAIFIYYLVTMLGFYLCSTIQNVPYHTLGLEMTSDYHERTVVSAYKMLFGFIFPLFTPWTFRFAQAEIFENVMEGMRTLSWGFAGFIILGGMLPALFCKERYYKIASQQDKVPFFKGLKMTFQNKSFCILTGIIAAVGVGSSLVGALGQYIIFYYIYDGDLKTGASLAAIGANAFSICALLSLPLITWMSGRLGKTRSLNILIISGIVGALSAFFLYNKTYPYLLIISQIFVAPLAAGFWTITASMKADVCDEDELTYAMRREGIFGSIGNWIMKLAFSLTFLLSGLILEATGFDIALKGDQSPDTLLAMRILFATVPALSSVLGLVLLKFYPLTEPRMMEIRDELEARRSAV